MADKDSKAKEPTSLEQAQADQDKVQKALDDAERERVHNIKILEQEKDE